MKCVKCGEPVNLIYTPAVNEVLEEHQMCHTDNFWREMVEKDKERPEKALVDANYEHYVVGDEAARMKGFYGDTFVIQRVAIRADAMKEIFAMFHGGPELTWEDLIAEEEIVTSNLWHQGQIPERWRDKFTPNARIVSRRT